MKISLFAVVTVIVVLLLCLIVFIYFQIYKKNINKALDSSNESPKQMIEPYKIVYVLVVFFVSFAITVAGVAGLMYSEDYFQYEKETMENVASRTIYINHHVESDGPRTVDSTDVKAIKQIISQKYSSQSMDVIHVYGVNGGLFLNGRPVNIFAIPKEYSSFLGLNKMKDDIVYFNNEEFSQIEFQVSVTKIVDGGFVSDKLEKMTFKAENGVSDKSLVATIKRENMTPSALEDPMCFVSMDTFYKIASVLVEGEINCEEDLDKYKGIISTEGIYICVDRLSYVNSVSSTLIQQNYNAYSPVDAFEDFEKNISASFMILILSSVGLVALSSVNIYLTIRTVKRIKNKEELL